jgi:hypothetical protein
VSDWFNLFEARTSVYASMIGSRFNFLEINQQLESSKSPCHIFFFFWLIFHGNSFEISWTSFSRCLLSL